jgi:hypothetical protein
MFYLKKTELKKFIKWHISIRLVKFNTQVKGLKSIPLMNYEGTSKNRKLPLH